MTFEVIKNQLEPIPITPDEVDAINEAKEKGYIISMPSSTPEEYCWKTGSYLSDCNCEECKHKDECPGYNG